MKVTLQKDYRQFYTLEDLDRAKMVIASEKENDEGTIASWAVYAVNEAVKDRERKGRKTYYYCDEENIFKATARTAKNCRAWNEYGEGTGNMDVWIEAYAFLGDCFVEIGAYLSDIWQSGSTEYAHHMYIRFFEESK